MFQGINLGRYLIAILFTFLGVIIFGVYPSPVHAAPCDPPVTNPISCENTQVGTPQSTWDVNGAGDDNIRGFTTDISYNLGSTAIFKINTNATAYRLDIYRMGYYQGNGARLITSIQPSVSLPQNQPNCLSDAATGLVDCGNWVLSASWQIPSTAVSGIYFAKLVRTDGTAGSSHIIFIVRDDSSHSDLLFQTSDTTWQAYNTYGGGNSLYNGGPGTNPSRAYKVSYNRPLTIRCCAWPNGNPFSSVFSDEYPMVRFLEQNGYNVSYFSGVDTVRNAALILNHKTFLSVGHDEYWSNEQRNNVQSARDGGVNLAFFSGNEIFWKTRWENSFDGNNTPLRTVVSYKETHANAVIDPLDPTIWTGSWRDPRFSPPADGNRPENALTGTMFQINGTQVDSMTFSGTYAPLRFWRNTSVATLTPSQTVTTPAGTLGYEWDIAPDNGFSPAGLMRMSSTTINEPNAYLLDYGSTYGAGTATHNLTLYRAASGALVFGAGTVQWSWGLDSHHDNGSNPVDPNMQQATVNLLADMGAQPSTIMSGLTTALQSTDTTRPASVITSPVQGANITPGSTVTVTGTASDVGGVVGAIEISTDGVTWRPATGTTNWSYSWTVPNINGNAIIRTRAIDDSANIEIPSAGVTVSIGTNPTPTPSPTTTPGPGQTVTFNDLANPNRALTGQYPTGFINWGANWWLAGTYGQFTTNSVSSTSSTITSNNFSLISPGILNSFQSYNGGGIATAVTAACTGNPTVSRSVGAGQLVTISTGWINNCTTITITSSNGWDTNFDNFIFGTGGPTPTPSPTPTPTPVPTPSPTPVPTPTPSPTPTPMPTPTQTPGTNLTIWSSTSTPSIPNQSDTNSVEIGVKFRSDVNGRVLGARFYKGNLNTGTHTGHLWSSTGTLLGSVTFSGETASGWQQANFATPIVITAGTTYVVSYHAPVGRYSVNQNYFASAGIDNGVLHALSNGTSGGNGIYTYGSGIVFPSNTYLSSNYWIDVVFSNP